MLGINSAFFFFLVFSYCQWGSPGNNTGVGCHFRFQWITFCQNSSLWPIHLEQPCPAWLIASLSSISPFPRRLWYTKTLKSPLDCKKIKPVNPKGNKPWIFFGRTIAEAEALILQPPDAKSLLTGKDPDAGKDWWQEEKGVTEDEMVGWHHQHKGHEFEQTPSKHQAVEPGVLQFKGLQRVRHDLLTKQQQINPAINQYQSPLLVLPRDHPLLTTINNFTLVYSGHHLQPRTALLTSSGPMWMHPPVFFPPFSGFCIPKRHPCYLVGYGEKRLRRVTGRKSELIAAF